MVLPLEVMAFSTWDGTSVAWTKGSGTQSSPYIIETAEQLAYLSQQVNAGNSYSGKYFRMDADVNLNGKQWTPIGTLDNPFSGHFDGGHHVVYNLYISNDNVDRVGLFGSVVDGGLKSVGIENCKIEVYDHSSRSAMILIGAVAGYVSNSGTLEYCYATGTTNVYNDAGDECSPYNSHYTLTGGVFGRVEDTDVSYCYNAVNMTEGTHRDIGGVIGYAWGSTIDYCYNVGDLRGLYCRAGILGWSGAGLTNINKVHYCYNRGRITTCQPIGREEDSNNYNGGIVACAPYTPISNCFTTGYMDNYAGKTSYGIAATAIGSAPRLNNYRLNTLNVAANIDQSGSSFPDAFFKGTGTALMFLGNDYQIDNNNTNDGYVIHKQSVYNTETCDVNKTGELQVMLDASVYAHNRAYRGIAWGLGEDIDAWSKVNTTDSVLNHIGLKDLEYDVKYGYIAYQMTPDGLKYGDDKYFLFKKDKFCDGDGYSYKGHSYTTGGDVVVVDKDTTTFLHLEMLPKIEVTLPEVSVCYEYTWEGQTTKQTTVLKTVVKSVLCGCDSTTYQPVTSKDSVVVVLPEVEECYEYTWEGQTTKKSARLRKLDMGANGCDSITYQPVIIKDSVVVVLPEVEECYEYTWEGQTTKKSARLRKLDTGANGCDSITYQPVIIKDSVVVVLPEVEECYEYEWEGIKTKTSARLRKLDVGANGCDSITYQPVIIKDSVVVTLPEVTECYEYTWEGQTTKKSARLRRVDMGVNGCDSITYQPVIIKYSVVVELPEVTACDEYTWEGQTTKKSARLRRVDMGVNGCDSITYQPVIINDSVVVVLPEVEECYEYTWEGQTTKKSARLRRVDLGANGCDSITYQPVIIKDSVVVTLPLVSACNFYDWEGMHTEESVDFRKLDTGANGCDSITYQPVEIYYSVEEYIEDTSYLLEPYKKNGFDLPVQTEIGDFNFELQLTTADKCDSTVYLLLHVIPNTNLDVIPAKFVEFRDGRFNWQIKNVEHYPNIHILIYDRFSRKVAEYRGYDNNNGWDGRYNGHLLPATDYWYWMKDDLIKGIITGHFTLYYKQGQW